MLTRKQRDFHLALADLAEELGRPPGLREAARLTGMKLTPAAEAARHLRERGMIGEGLALVRAPAPPAETLEITPAGRAALAAHEIRPGGAS